MFMSKLVGRTIKETPRDAELPSHRFLLRAGYARQYSAGIYGLLPLAMRSVGKIERICREEMNRVDGQEVRLPCMSSRELWEESGRYQAIGKDMFRLKDRNDKDMVLNMTHEEPVVFLARTELTSYRQLPAMLYQVQTKFRDEPRPRGGLVRLREFTMKDAYSFHASEDDLKAYYDRMHEAYMRFFKRCGAKKFVSVLSDNGMFGGKFSHEFMTLVPTGEDTLVTCSHCDYKANREVATSPYRIKKEPERALTRFPTPGAKTIEQLVAFCAKPDVTEKVGGSVAAADTAKAVLYQNKQEELVVAFVRGDLDIEEQKLKVALQMDLFPAKDEPIRRAKAVPGSTGPLGLDVARAWVVLDNSVVESTNLVTGANEDGMHIANLNIARDFLQGLSDWERKRVLTADVASARAGDPCPQCSHDLEETRGIEIGNIFHLGTRYSASMNMTFLDTAGKAQTPVMGCYGIGITRLLPALIEEHHDDRGPILPLPVAPFHVHMCMLNMKDAGVLETALGLKKSLEAQGVEVLLDDRDEKPGSQFADADLIGIPLRVILSPKTLAEQSFEFKFRDNREPAKLVKLEGAMAFLSEALANEWKKYSVD